MGSGKSTVGQELALRLNYSFIDLDDYIANKEQKSISEIFGDHGEIYFRKRESLYLKDLLHGVNNTVLALGGGTPCYGVNLNTILNSEGVISFYLKLNIPSLVKRLTNEKAMRPVISHLQSEDDLSEFIGKHLFERSPFYLQSTHILTLDDKNVRAVVDEILVHLI
jgi:shikimate kinase